MRKSLFLFHLTELIRFGLFIVALVFVNYKELVMVIFGITAAFRNFLQLGMLTYILFRMRCVYLFLSVKHEKEYPDVALTQY